jgi:hypothetical protein
MAENAEEIQIAAFMRASLAVTPEKNLIPRFPLPGSSLQYQCVSLERCILQVR